MLKKIFNNILRIEKFRNKIIIHILFFKISLKEKKLKNESKIDSNKILFYSFSSSYSCNPKYIAEEIMRRNLPYKLVWTVDNRILKHIYDFPRNIELVMKHSPEDYEAHKTAKIWISNDRKTGYVKNGIIKKNNQVYIQTFHGSIGFKKVGIDRGDISQKLIRLQKKDAQQIDYLISNSTFETDLYKRTFFNKGNILEFGHPRNDILFKDNSLYKKKICDKYNISQNSKLIMYAPTFRENYCMKYYDIDWNALINTLEKKFGGNWIPLLRLHPRLLNYRDEFLNKNENIVDVTGDSDIQELMAASDCLITDYSSCILDFLLSGKYGFIYATDEKKYNNERGLYYPLRSTPFPVATNMQEMINNIENFDENLYTQKAKEFLKDKGCIEDGHAAEKVVDLIEQIMREDK